MKKSKTKYNRRFYVVFLLVMMVFIGFSALPVLSTAVGRNWSLSKTEEISTIDQIASVQAKLEKEAQGYQLVLQREPDNETALRGLLEVTLKLGDVQGIIPPLQKLADLNLQGTDYRILLALAKEQVGDQLGAAQDYEVVLANEPRNLSALVGMANLLLRQDRPEASIGLVEDAIQNEARINSAESKNNLTFLQLLLGDVYGSLERYPEAIAVYDQVIDSNKEDFRPLLAKAKILRKQGKEEQAKLFFGTAKDVARPEDKDQIQEEMLEKTKEHD